MDLSMSGIYDAQINLETEERMRNVIGMSVAAAMKLKDYGYNDEAIYEIIQVLFGMEVKADQEKIDSINTIMDVIHKQSNIENADQLLDKLRSIIGGI